MYNTAILWSLVFLLFSCNSGNKKSSLNSEEVSKSEITTTDSKSYDCLNSYQDDYSKLLTKDEMASVYSIPFEEANEDLSTGSYGNHTYSWPSDRPKIEMEAAGIKVKTPDKNRIGVKNLSFYSNSSTLQDDISLFDQGYKKLSEAELKQIEDNLKEQSEEVRKTGERLMEVRKKSNWQFIDGLGSSAWFQWNEKHGGELSVLAGKAKFTIVIKISDDPSENKDLAVQLAQKVLDKC